MDLGFNTLLLQFEILLLTVSLIYAFYYLSSRIFYYISYVRWVVRPQRSKTFREPFKKENKEHFDHKEYKEEIRKVWEKEKAEIRDLLKRIRLNKSRWEFEIARNLIIEALMIDKINRDVNLELAALYISEDNFLKAEFIYKDLLIVYNNDFEVLKKLWFVLSNQEKYELAIQVYKKANSINRNDLEVVHMLAYLHYCIWDYLESVNFFKKYLKERPRDVDNLISLSEVYKKMGNVKEAVITLKRALDINPYNEFIHRELKELETPETVTNLENNR